MIIVLFGVMCLDKAQAYAYDYPSAGQNTYTIYSESDNNYSSYSHNDCKVFATPQPSIDDSRPCTTQMLGNPNSNISENVSIRTNIRYSARLYAMIMSDSSESLCNHEHYFAYNKSMENLFSIQTIVVNYIHNTDGDK